MRAGRHRSREEAEDIAAGVVALSTDDLDLLLAEARTEEESLGYAEELLGGRLDLALAEAERRGMVLAGPELEALDDGVRPGRDDVRELVGKQQVPSLTERSDADIRAAAGVLNDHLRDVRDDLERIRGLVRVVGDERARRHG
ncbi:MAG TPA: hypothetical protein VK908_07245 [Jiangellales bacterium]|nr:hypothetical protein [Jiangellales bacterium]